MFQDILRLKEKKSARELFSLSRSLSSIANTQHFFLIRTSRTFWAGLAALPPFWHLASKKKKLYEFQTTNLQMSHLQEEGRCPGSPRACLVLVAFPTPLGSWAPEERGEAELKCWSGSTKVPGQTGLGSCLLVAAGPSWGGERGAGGCFLGQDLD